jgi:hypothetical protein
MVWSTIELPLVHNAGVSPPQHLQTKRKSVLKRTDIQLQAV